MKNSLPAKYVLALILFIIWRCENNDLAGQTKYILNTGSISFFSSAPLEDIKADNNHFSSEIDLGNASVTFTVPIGEFVFRKSLMKQHFNEQYMESNKFPTAFFTGFFNQTILPGENQQPPSKNKIKGTLTIKGISRTLEEEVILGYVEDEITGFCKFNVRVADFGVKIPRLLVRNIAEVVEVTVNVKYKKIQ